MARAGRFLREFVRILTAGSSIASTWTKRALGLAIALGIPTLWLWHLGPWTLLPLGTVALALAGLLGVGVATGAAWIKSAAPSLTVRLASPRILNPVVRVYRVEVTADRDKPVTGVRAKISHMEPDPADPMMSIPVQIRQDGIMDGYDPGIIDMGPTERVHFMVLQAIAHEGLPDSRQLDVPTIASYESIAWQNYDFEVAIYSDNAAPVKVRLLFVADSGDVTLA
jgi:hypothetical protein